LSLLKTIIKPSSLTPSQIN